jgi:iron-sulfur cluster assembly protein
LLTLTQNATSAIEGLLAGPGMPDSAGIRIASAITGDGNDPGALQLGLAAAPDDHDRVIQDHGARVFVEDAVVPLLDDKLLDADADGEQVRFSILGSRAV